jgi:hypothetical protein
VTDDNEAFAALAQQIEDLRGVVGKFQAIVTAWNARLEREGIGGTLMLRLEVKKMSEKLDEALENYRLKPVAAPYWAGLPDDKFRAQLAELGEWIETFLRLHYPGYMRRIPACWANHPEALWELSTLRAEWIRIYGDEERRELADALVWHERWLPGVIARLEKAITCDQGGCRVVPRPRLRA